MRILSFEFHDADGWTLTPTKFDAFNLLVGVSGAGKTRIVRAIERVCSIALGSDHDWRPGEAGGVRFCIDFEHAGTTYRWTAELEQARVGIADPAASPLIRTERIEQDGQPLVERTAERFAFQGREIPRLDRAKSAIATLKEDPSVAPLGVAFSQCVNRALDIRPILVFRLAEEGPRYESVEALGADFTLPLMNKALLLHEQFPLAFAEIVDSFRDAFPAITRLEAGREIEPRPNGRAGEKTYIAFPYLAAHESGVRSPVGYAAMSSGMQRYLSFLVHLSFAPPGTVVLIDELEASLGINCLPAATQFLLRRAPDLQLILTSHHPYIIEQIPMRHWKIVTRKGSEVRVLDATRIPALDESRSRLDRFTRLINLPEYEQGIQA